MKNITLPEGAEKIISELEQRGFEAWAVGGCVRDSIMGMTPKDWDICTSALPWQTAQCFSQHSVIETGLKHGTVTVILNKEHYEVTTYRLDGEYQNHRQPETVEFVSSLREDLARRDFTVNAMAYNSKRGLVDYYDGLHDIEAKQIRCVGIADRRFNEDALRILRALRFASALGFKIHEETAASIHKNKELLNSISRERINSELCKFILGRGVKALLMDYSDVMNTIIPQFKGMQGFRQNNPHHCFDVWEHTAQAVSEGAPERYVRLALLFHDIGKPGCYQCDDMGIGHFYGHAPVSAAMSREILNNLKFDKESVKNIVQLVEFHDGNIAAERKNVRRWLNRLGEEQLKRLIDVKYGDIMAQSEYMREEKLKNLKAFANTAAIVLKEQDCFKLKDLELDGRDVIAAGIHEGRDIGHALNFLLEQVIEGNLENKKDVLLKALIRLRNSGETADE